MDCGSIGDIIKWALRVVASRVNPAGGSLPGDSSFKRGSVKVSIVVVDIHFEYPRKTCR